MKRLGEPPHVCLITEGKATPKNFASEKPRILDTIRDAVSDGVTLIQIREKSLPARLLFELSVDAVAMCKKTPARVMVNDRADIAVASRAHGVHLPEASLHPQVIRRSFGNDLIIGVSTHSIESASSAVENGADYIFFGPVFATPGKESPTGLDVLRDVCRELEGFPVIAIGGIHQDNCERVLEAGAAGIAAIRATHVLENRRRMMAVLSAGKLR